MCAAINVSLACPINRQMSPRNVFALLARRSVRWVGPSDGCCRRTDRPSCIVSALLAGYCTVGLVLYRRERRVSPSPAACGLTTFTCTMQSTSSDTDRGTTFNVNALLTCRYCSLQLRYHVKYVLLDTILLGPLQLDIQLNT